MKKNAPSNKARNNPKSKSRVDVGHSQVSILKPGIKAPNFTLHSTPDQTVSLRDFRGRPVILVFYPADWSPVCTDQLSLYSQVLNEFHQYNNPEHIAISVDGIWSHLAFAKDRKIRFP